MRHREITFDRFIRGLITIAAVVGLYFLLDKLSFALLPFFVAWLVAYLIYPVVKFFQYRLRVKYRILAIFCTLFLVSLVLGCAFVLLVPPMVDEFGRLKDLLVEHFITRQGKVDASSSIPQVVNEFINEYVDMRWFYQMLSEENVHDLIRETLPQLWKLISGSVNVLLNVLAMFIILLYVVFILLDYEQLASGWSKLVPHAYRPMAEHLVNDVQVAMNRYFRGQSLIAFLVGVLFCVGFLIIDFPLAIGLGLFIGVLNMVPYLQVVSLVPTLLLALLKSADTGENFWWVLGSALLVYVVVQIIQDGFLTPRIMGKVTGLNPAIILLSLSVWGSLLGLIGMIIALPLTTLLLSYYNGFISKTKEDANKPEQSGDG